MVEPSSLPRTLLFTPTLPPRPFANDTFGLSPDRPAALPPAMPAPFILDDEAPSTPQSG